MVKCTRWKDKVTCKSWEKKKPNPSGSPWWSVPGGKTRWHASHGKKKSLIPPAVHGEMYPVERQGDMQVMDKKKATSIEPGLIGFDLRVGLMHCREITMRMYRILPDVQFWFPLPREHSMTDFPQFDGRLASSRPLGQYVTFPLTLVPICLKSKKNSWSWKLVYFILRDFSLTSNPNH